MLSDHQHSVPAPLLVPAFLLMLFPPTTGALNSSTLRAAEPAYSKLREMNQVGVPPEGQTIAMVHAKILDGRGGEPIEDGTILVKGNRIVAVGLGRDIDIPDGAVREDLTGKSVLPGLFDSHFHSQNSVQVPVQYCLHNGVTSFRDPGHPFKYYDVLLHSNEVIPRVFLCGGHLDAEPVVWPDQAARVASEADAKRWVKSHVERGASAIKVYFRVPLDHMQAACEQAHALGIPVTTHLELVDADDAINAGVDAIEHITSFGTALAPPELAQRFKEVVHESSDARRDWRYRLWEQIEIEGNHRVEELVQLLVEKQTFVSPTLAVFERRIDEKADNAPTLAFGNMLHFLTKCHEAGAKIVVGSHTSGPFAERGKAYLREVELLREAGMTPLEIITAATKNNAEFFGVAERLGTLEIGKIADLLVVDGNPAQDITHLDRVAKVMLNGQWVALSE